MFSDSDMMFICMYICVCSTKQQQITSCMVKIQYLTEKVQKLLQWCCCFKTVISQRLICSQGFLLYSVPPKKNEISMGGYGVEVS